MVTVEASISGVGRQPLIRGILFACISASLASCGDRAAPLAPWVKGERAPPEAAAFRVAAALRAAFPMAAPISVGSDGATNGDGRVATDEGCQPILNQAGLTTGFESCADGSKRRSAAILCPEERTSPSNPCQAIVGPYSCKSDSDCVAQPGGYCADAHQIVGYCGCYYGCRQDSDCGAGSICECGVVVGHCVPATCTTNADCGVGLACAKASAVQGPVAACVYWNAPISSYTCQTPMDQCQSDSTCPANGLDRGVCLFDGGHRICGTMCFMPV